MIISSQILKWYNIRVSLSRNHTTYDHLQSTPLPIRFEKVLDHLFLLGSIDFIRGLSRYRSTLMKIYDPKSGTCTCVLQVKTVRKELFIFTSNSQKRSKRSSVLKKNGNRHLKQIKINKRAANKTRVSH